VKSLSICWMNSKASIDLCNFGGKLSGRQGPLVLKRLNRFHGGQTMIKLNFIT
jgi:hypothetical protein